MNGEAAVRRKGRKSSKFKASGMRSVIAGEKAVEACTSGSIGRIRLCTEGGTFQARMAIRSSLRLPPTLKQKNNRKIEGRNEGERRGETAGPITISE